MPSSITLNVNDVIFFRCQYQAQTCSTLVHYGTTECRNLELATCAVRDNIVQQVKG